MPRHIRVIVWMILVWAVHPFVAQLGLEYRLLAIELLSVLLLAVLVVPESLIRQQGKD